MRRRITDERTAHNVAPYTTLPEKSFLHIDLVDMRDIHVRKS